MEELTKLEKDIHHNYVMYMKKSEAKTKTMMDNLDVSRSATSMWFRGLRCPGYKSVDGLCQILGISRLQFFADPDDLEMVSILECANKLNEEGKRQLATLARLLSHADEFRREDIA